MKADVIKLSGILKGAIDEVDHKFASGSRNIELDFQQVTFISVEGLEWLEELLLRSSSYKCDVHFANVPTSIYKVFKVAHIESIFAACGTLPVTGPAC